LPRRAGDRGWSGLADALVKNVYAGDITMRPSAALLSKYLNRRGLRARPDPRRRAAGRAPRNQRRRRPLVDPA
jgi:hypothetical protein